MPVKKQKRNKPAEGRRVSLWLPAKPLKTATEIDNLSKFLQLALLMASDIMAWAILQDHDPTTYYSVKMTKKLMKQYNAKYPLDPLTIKRLQKNGTNPQRRNTPVNQESNPALR